MRRFIVLTAFMAAFAFSLPVAAKGIWIKDARTGCAVWNAAPGSNETITWSGPCKGGKAHGKGVLQWFVKGKPAGRYEGEFRNGRKYGQGVYTWANGSRYEGGWLNGRVHGRGVIVWTNGNRYAGGFRKGKKHGKGVFTWADGGRYTGEYRNGKKHGQGVKTWANGRRYEGRYRNGRPHGFGSYSSPGKTTLSGTWTNGCFRQASRTKAWIGTTKAECNAAKNEQAAKNEEMELDPAKGHAVCKQKKNGGWLCDGPLQKVSSGKRSLKTALKMAGCKGPDFIGVWTSWQLYECSQDVGRRNILKKYNII